MQIPTYTYTPIICTLFWLSITILTVFATRINTGISLSTNIKSDT